MEHPPALPGDVYFVPKTMMKEIKTMETKKFL